MSPDVVSLGSQVLLLMFFCRAVKSLASFEGKKSGKGEMARQGGREGGG